MQLTRVHALCGSWSGLRARVHPSGRTLGASAIMCVTVRSKYLRFAHCSISSTMSRAVWYLPTGKVTICTFCVPNYRERKCGWSHSWGTSNQGSGYITSSSSLNWICQGNATRFNDSVLVGIKLVFRYLEAPRTNHRLVSCLLYRNQLFRGYPTGAGFQPAFPKHLNFFLSSFSSTFQNFLNAKQAICFFNNSPYIGVRANSVMGGGGRKPFCQKEMAWVKSRIKRHITWKMKRA